MSDGGVMADMPHIFKWFQSTANVERLAIKSNHSSFNYNQIYLHILLLNMNEKTTCNRNISTGCLYVEMLEIKLGRGTIPNLKAINLFSMYT